MFTGRGRSRQGENSGPDDGPDAKAGQVERTERAVNLLKKRYGLTIRPLNMKRFAAEVELVKQLYNDCWEDNWGFIPMTVAVPGAIWRGW